MVSDRPGSQSTTVEVWIWTVVITVGAIIVLVLALIAVLHRRVDQAGLDQKMT